MLLDHLMLHGVLHAILARSLFLCFALVLFLPAQPYGSVYSLNQIFSMRPVKDST